MTEEIKRIIEELKEDIPMEEYRSEGTSDGLTHYEEDKDSWQYKLVVYITNLQQDLDKAIDTIGKNRQFYKCRMDEYVELKKENEELKQTLHNITINDVEEENTTVLDLINENEKLKREKQRLLYNLEKVCEERDEEE